MSMSTHVIGIRRIYGRKFTKMVEVKRICEGAGVDYPKEVYDYFAPHKPSESVDYLRSEMLEVDLSNLECVVEDNTHECQERYRVILDKLPDSDDLCEIVFVNSY